MFLEKKDDSFLQSYKSSDNFSLSIGILSYTTYNVNPKITNDKIYL